jgi:precorrin-6A synthase
VRRLLLIGIGTGNPDHVTVQAVDALNRVDVFFVVDKGEAKAELLELRDEILRRHVRDSSAYRIVEIPDPPRDRDAAAYEGAVADWHERRAELFEQAIAAELAEEGVGAFLVWGDPSLYDSTLRVVDRILARGQVAFDYEVIAGITSVQALTAAHRIPLNRIGEPITITPARRLTQHVDNAVVMLDGGFKPSGFDDPELNVYWGAYLGSADEVIVAGPLTQVASEIERTKAELRAKHGWIMDTYLLRREPAKDA